MAFTFLTLARQHPVFPGETRKLPRQSGKKNAAASEAAFFLLRFYDMCDKLVPSIFLRMKREGRA